MTAVWTSFFDELMRVVFPQLRFINAGKIAHDGFQDVIYRDEAGNRPLRIERERDLRGGDTEQLHES